MGTTVTNNVTTQPLTTSGTSTNTMGSASTGTTGEAAALVDVFVALAGALTQGSVSSGSLTSGGSQSSATLTSSATNVLLELAEALVDVLGGASSNTGVTTSTGTGTGTGGGTAGSSSTVENTGNNSNTGTSFNTALLPGASAGISQCTQAGAAAIDNMPASTMANLSINGYVAAAQTQMQNAGFSASQVQAFMTGLDEAYEKRNPPPPSSTGTSATSTSSTYNPVEKQTSLPVENTNT